MPVYQILTPNLVTNLTDIDTLSAAIVAATPTSFDTLINDCFKLKPTQDCETLFVEDFTDYQELGVVDINDVTIVVSLSKKNDCGCKLICGGLIVDPNSKITFENLIKDGTYSVEITITYVLDIFGVPTTFTKTICESYVKDCCKREYKKVSFNICSRMATISCTIAQFSTIGRSIKSLKQSYMTLSNLLWVYYHAADSCLEVEKIKCIYNKIR